jgi:DNA-3-methyladenine glycosylase II
MVDRYADRTFMRPLAFGGVPVLIKIAYGDGGLTSRLNIEWNSPGEIDGPHRLRRKLVRMFFLDFDIERFYAHRLDRVMRGLTRKFVGFRPIQTPDIFEAAAWSIIGQQVNLQFAYRLKSRVVEYVGRTFAIDGSQYFLFPTAEEVAGIDYDRLRSMQFSGRKAEYLLDFSRMVAEGRFDLEALVDMDYDEALSRLLEVRGLGPWSANYILMRGAGHQDAFPIGDSGINHAVRKLYGLDKKPEIGYLQALSEKWRPYRSLATFYLWKSL